jgi:hypothetical protein
MRRRGWRLLRQRGLRGRSGQVSAVATLLALMLFVSFLATFVLGQLPSQMVQQEFQHQLLVEDQMERLQTSLLAAEAAWIPASSTTSSPVAWNSGNLCTTLTATSCTNGGTGICNPGLSYNQSVNGADFLYDLSGSGDCIRLNITGNENTFTLEVTGSNQGYFSLALYGFNNTIILNNQFSGSNFHAYFYLYGGYDTYETNGGPTGSPVYINTNFIGESATADNCPTGNLSSTDTWSITDSSSTNSIQNFTWYNNVGYSRPYATTLGWPGVGNSGSGSDHVGWQNVSGPVGCAFGLTSIVGSPSSVYLSSPITLQSGGVPPFGTPSSGALAAESTQVSTKASFGISNVSGAPIGWNKGSACFAATAPGSGTCTAGTGLEVYNFSGNATTVSPTVAGCAVAGCTVIYNVTGNTNTLSLTISGANIQNVLYQVSGNHNALTVKDSGTCNIRQRVTVVFSGNNDTYTLQMTGCTAGVGANLNTTFVGSSGNICPYGSEGEYNTFTGATWGSSTGVFQNLTWRNAYGLVSAPNTIPANGGDHLTFANTSGYFQCLFTTATNSGPYTLNFQSGVKAVLNNRYIFPSTVAYDQGAVILGVENGGSVMLSPPDVTFVQNPGGIQFSITLFSIVASTGTATGYGTAAVITHILSVQTYQINDGKGGPNFLPYFYLNITTPYPQAWATYWQKLSPIDPTRTTCVPGFDVTVANCLTPPFGRLSTIVVPINANQFVFTSVLAQVTIF